MANTSSESIVGQVWGSNGWMVLIVADDPRKAGYQVLVLSYCNFEHYVGQTGQWLRSNFDPNDKDFSHRIV